MKMNVGLFKSIIDLLRSEKVKPSKFRFDILGIGGCGCTIHHAYEAGLIKDNDEIYCHELKIPKEDQSIIFGSTGDKRDFYFNGYKSTKEFVANFMEDYLIAVEAGMVEGVEA